MRVYNLPLWGGDLLRFSPDGRLVIAGNERVGVLWDCWQDRLVERFVWADDRPPRAAFSPCGRYLAYAEPRRVVLYDLAEQRRLWEKGALDPVGDVAFTPAGELVAVGFRALR